MAEQGLLGRVLCEEALPLDAPISPWAGEGGYGRAPGFEREDQVGEAVSLDRRPAGHVWIFCLNFFFLFLCFVQFA